MRTGNVVRLKQMSVCCGECRLQRVCIAQGLSVDSPKTSDRGVVKRGRPLARGEHLYRQGERLHALYVVRSGSVKSYVSTPDGLEQVVRFYLPGEFVGLDALGEEIHTSSAQTLETTSVCRFPYEMLNDLCERIPELRMQVLKIAGREVTQEHNRAVLLAQRAAEERLAAFLLQMSAQYARRGFSEHEFNLPMSRQDIASYLALAVETVSRLFTGFQNAGLLHVERRNVRLNSLERLQAMVCASRATALA